MQSQREACGLLIRQRTSALTVTFLGIEPLTSVIGIKAAQTILSLAAPFRRDHRPTRPLPYFYRSCVGGSE